MRYFFKADGSEWKAVDDGVVNIGLGNVFGESWDSPIEWTDGHPGDGRNTLNVQTMEIVEYQPPIDYQSIANQIESAFLQFIPNHQGEAYLTGAVKALVWTAKPAVTEAIKAGALVDARDIIESLTLPTEMQSDQQTLISQLNSLIGA